MVVKKVFRKSKSRMEWALVSKSNPKRVLQYFGMKKPSQHDVLRSEGRIHFFKNFGSSPRTVKVRSHNRKGTKGVRSHSRKVKGGVISKRNRQVFDLMSKQKSEFGGDLDFGKVPEGSFRSLERFNTFVGKPGYVEMPADFEGSWHTHPKGSYRTPSEYDMAEFIKSKGNQASIIWSGGKAVNVVKTPKSRWLKKFSKKQLIERYTKFYDVIEEKNLVRSKAEGLFMKQLRMDGFKVIDHNKKGTAIRLPIKVIE